MKRASCSALGWAAIFVCGCTGDELAAGAAASSRERPERERRLTLCGTT